MMLKQRKLYAARKKLGAGVELEVCWRDDRFGKGPCFSVYERGREMLRFDLFDTQPHWHTYREAAQPRHYFIGHRDGVTDGRRTFDRARLHQSAIEVAATKYDIRGDAVHWLTAELWDRAKHG